MTADAFPCEDTDRLVLPQKLFYPAKIPIAHYQLRHFISSPEPDIIYYASGTTVYSLNTATRERNLITSLGFEARCTASGHGWVCVGGEEYGHFAAIKVEGGLIKPDTPPAPDVDDSLPLSFRRPAGSRRPLLRSSGTSPVKIERIGELIVNSISIHKIDADDGTEEVVAVLTNNDKTVRIYSLTHGLESFVLDLDFPINHATISPNGQFLVAVGDLQQAFFFERTSKARRLFNLELRNARVACTPPGWSVISIVQLHVPPSSLTRGYFTTAWSPSGNLVAVGSECGYITVFDMDLITTAEYGEDAIVQVLRSSRPDNNHGPGAVRTMCFSPQPWDLLIWAEDHGRVCVADLRTGLQTKQTVELIPDSADVQTIDIAQIDSDVSRFNPLDLERLEDSPDDHYSMRLHQIAFDSDSEPATADLAQDFIDASAERRRLLRHQGTTSSDWSQGLNTQERQILEALRTTRQREEERERERSDPSRSDRRARPEHDGETSGPLSRRNGIIGSSSNENRTSSLRANASSSQDFPPLRRERSGSIGSAMTVLPSLGSIRDFLRERDRATSETDRGPLFQPRRRASVVLLNEGASGSSNSGGSAPRPNAGASSANLHSDSQTASPSDPWRTIEAAMSRSPLPTSSRARGTPPHYMSPGPPAATSGPSPAATAAATAAVTAATLPSQPTATTINTAEARRMRQMSRARERMGRTAYETTFLRGSRGIMSRTWNPEWGLRTAGLAMTADGRRLFVGTEAGIFEMGINLGNRKAWPAVEPR